MKITKLGWALLIIPLVAAVVSLPFLPQQIPLRFDMAFRATKYGSKYFIFIAALLPFAIYIGIKRKYRL